MSGYDLRTDPYLDPASGVFINKLGITDADQLAEREAGLTSIAIAEATRLGVSGAFNLSHLCAVHVRIFGDIYPWAGRLRTVEMEKGSTRFANAEYLTQAAENTLALLRQDLLETIAANDEYIRLLAHHYSEVNLLHPFREGNGRTERVFFSSLAGDRGGIIDWDFMDAAQNIQACQAAYHGDETGLVEMFTKLYRR